MTGVDMCTIGSNRNARVFVFSRKISMILQVYPWSTWVGYLTLDYDERFMKGFRYWWGKPTTSFSGISVIS